MQALRTHLPTVGVPVSKNRVLWVAWLALAAFLSACTPSQGADSAAPVFVPLDAGGYAFDTGVLQGKLNADGKTLGLTDVVHKSTGRSVAGRWGLMHLYRVFSGSRRFGPAARDWDTTSRLLDNGAVEVRWPPSPEHPFELCTVYRWHDAATLDIHISVQAVEDLPTFELFLASYFDADLANPFVYVEKPGGAGKGPGFLLAEQSLGHWQMAPRDAAAVAIIRNGRWEVGPSPVDWVILPPLAGPVALRRDRHSGLAAAVMAPKTDCFAVSMPYAGESHCSLYLSLFGRDLAAGEQDHARARLAIGTGMSDANVADHYRQYDANR